VLVSELDGWLANRQESIIATSVSEFEINDNATSVELGGRQYTLDEIAMKAMAKFLDIPYTYLKGCPATFKAETLKFWRDEYAEVDALVEVVSGDIVSIHSPEVLNVPLSQIATVIERVFEGDDTIKIFRPGEQLQFDVISRRHQIEVPNPDNVRFRPEVGDITHGGVRMLFHPHANKQPSAVPYLERYVCTNGMCSDEKLGRIAIKGNTLPEILNELEAAARVAMAGIDDRLDTYASTARIPAPGSPLAFALQLARELKLPASVMDEVTVLINQLPNPASVYDVNQVFTAVANLDVPQSARVKLQTLGGSLAFEPRRMIARCNTCEQLL
jgi:hypothetical protein